MRTKVVALLVSLIALWSFAAFVTVREGLNLLWVSTLDKGIAEPNEVLLPSLQEERRLSLVYLGSGDAGARRGMLAQRKRTDEAATTFREKASDSTVQLAASPTLERLITESFGRIDGLAQERSLIDARRADRAAAAAAFAEITDSIFRLYDAMATVDDDDTAKDARTLIRLTRAREILAREDALLDGALASGAITKSEQRQFIQLVGAQRFEYAEAMADLRPEDRELFEELFANPTFTRVRQLEDATITWTPGEPLPLTAAEWESALRPAFPQVHQAVLAGGDRVVARAMPIGIAVVARLILAGVLGLIAVIASIIVSITTARALIRQLERLRAAARDLASYRLPRVVDRLQHGEKVDVEQEAPPLDFGTDEIGQVGQAFNAVQETAVRVAVEQAELRRSVRDVFLSLARRSQALLHRQLALLDGMERRATDSEELAELFRVDHLATRMRRNAENLIVLSGATAGRAWRRPVPMIDVLRGALAEVEDYTRVSVMPVGGSALLGRTVGDVIHLLAELIENAVSFSPPQTVVRVGGSVVGNGFAIEIEDRGLGMSEEERAAANEQLRDPPEFKLSSTARLGLYVVGKLAERHGIRVRLTESPYGGTTAIVLLPAALMADEPSEALDLSSTLEGTGQARPAKVAIGRHRSDAGGDQLVLASTSASSATQTQHLLADQSSPLCAEVVENGSRHILALDPDVSTPQASAAPAAPAATSLAATSPSVAEMSTAPPADAQPNGAFRPEPPILTPSGLPWRQRMSGPVNRPGSPAPVAAGPTHPEPRPLQHDISTGTGSVDAPYTRGAEDMRSRISAYRSGTLRGRTDAAKLADQTHMPGPATASGEPLATEEEG